MIVGWPGAAQDRLSAYVPGTRGSCPGVPRRPGEGCWLLLLWHENAVLRRRIGRVRYEPADGVWFAALSRLLPRRRWREIFAVTPATLLAWHRKLAAAKYDTSGQRKPGPPKSPGIALLVVRLARENPLRGYRRIHRELTKPGLTVAPSTVWEILHAAGIVRLPAGQALPGGSSCTPRPPARRRCGADLDRRADPAGPAGWPAQMAAIRSGSGGPCSWAK